MNASMRKWIIRSDVVGLVVTQRHPHRDETRLEIADGGLDGGAELFPPRRARKIDAGKIGNAVIDERELQIVESGRQRQATLPRIQEIFEVAAHGFAQLALGLAA